MSWRVKLVALLIIGAFVAFAFSYNRLYINPKKHGIILFIAPGLGGELLSLAETQSASRSFQALGNPSQIYWVRSRSPGSITGNLPSMMTYLSCGTPSLGNQVGLSVTGQRLNNLFYDAQRQGRSLGIVSTTYLTSPGVSAFYAHNENASLQYDTATQLLDNAPLDFIFGGGGEVFQQTLKHHGRDLVKEAELNDYRIVRTRTDFDAIQPWRRKKIFAYFAPSDLPYHLEHPSPPNDDTPPRLAELTRLTVQKLQYNFGGYFLVINHELIAKACYQNRSRHAIAETIELDEAVNTAIRYAGKNTLVLVYAPFEIGGLQAVADPLLQKNVHNVPAISWHNGPGQSSRNPLRYPDAEPSGFHTPRALINTSNGFLLVFGGKWESSEALLNAGSIHALINQEL